MRKRPRIPRPFSLEVFRHSHNSNHNSEPKETSVEKNQENKTNKPRGYFLKGFAHESAGEKLLWFLPNNREEVRRKQRAQYLARDRTP